MDRHGLEPYNARRRGVLLGSDALDPRKLHREGPGEAPKMTHAIGWAGTGLNRGRSPARSRRGARVVGRWVRECSVVGGTHRQTDSTSPRSIAANGHRQVRVTRSTT